MRIDPRDLTTRHAAATPPVVDFRSPPLQRPERDELGNTESAMHRRRREPLRTGHRRDLDLDRKGEREGRSFEDRRHAALVDVSVHRVVAYQDLIDAQFDGHPYAGRRGIDRLKRAGLLEEGELTGPQGGSYKVLAATKGGARVAEKMVARHGYASTQRTWAGLGRPADLTHDVAVYRAVIEARRQLAKQGAALRRVRLDAELRREVASRSEAARAQQGKAAADQARRRTAQELHLPIQRDGSVLYPDAQIEYEIEHPDGLTTGRVNIEVASEHYRGAHLVAKAAAGFAVYPANGKAGRAMTKAGLGSVARALGREDGSATGGGGRRRDSAAVEL